MDPYHKIDLSFVLKPKEEVDQTVCSNHTLTKESLLQNSEFWTTPKEMGTAKSLFWNSDLLNFFIRHFGAFYETDTLRESSRQSIMTLAEVPHSLKLNSEIHTDTSTTLNTSSLPKVCTLDNMFTPAPKVNKALQVPFWLR